jgi:hypothetical protein
MTTTPHDPSKPWTYDECVRGPRGDNRQPPEPISLPNCITCGAELTAYEFKHNEDECDKCWQARVCPCGNEYAKAGQSEELPDRCRKCFAELVAAKLRFQDYVESILESNDLALIEENIRAIRLPK